MNHPLNQRGFGLIHWGLVFSNLFSFEPLQNPSPQDPSPPTPPKFHERTPKRGKKERKLWRERKKKKTRILGLPTFGAPHFGPPPFNNNGSGHKTKNNSLCVLFCVFSSVFPLCFLVFFLKKKSLFVLCFFVFCCFSHVFFAFFCFSFVLLCFSFVLLCSPLFLSFFFVFLCFSVPFLFSDASARSFFLVFLVSLVFPLCFLCVSLFFLSFPRDPPEIPRRHARKNPQDTPETRRGLEERRGRLKGCEVQKGGRFQGVRGFKVEKGSKERGVRG